MEEEQHTYKRETVPYPVSIFSPPRLCRTIAKIVLSERKEQRKPRVIPFRTKPRWMKSRVNGLLRERRRERKREGAGKPDSEREGDWKREEEKGRERKSEGRSEWRGGKKNVRQLGPRDREREGEVEKMTNELRRQS